jgi:hypothetical protein
LSWILNADALVFGGFYYSVGEQPTASAVAGCS